MSKLFQSPTIESESASCKQLPVMHIKHDLAPDMPIASPIAIKRIYNFLQPQRCNFMETVLCQGNCSTTLMKSSACFKGSCQLAHPIKWYFSTTNHNVNKDLLIRHHPTEEMGADFFTRPLLGYSFAKFLVDLSETNIS